MDKKVLKNLLLLSIILSSGVLFGQAFDVETEKIMGIHKLVQNYYNQNYPDNISKAEFEYDDKGNAIRASYYYGNRLVSQNEYRYDENGLIVQEIEKVFANNKSTSDTISYTYKFDSENRIICKEKLYSQSKWIITTLFQDFDSNSNAQTLLQSSIYSTHTSKIKFNSKNQPIYKEKLANNSILEIEEIEYNSFGDIVYSNIPTLIDNLTGKVNEPLLLLRNRYSVVENYEYKYDESNRWTERYVIHKQKKILLNKRLYK